MWLTKYLTDLPQIQTKLRSVLYDTLSAAKEENRLFTFEEIHHAKLPYLNAVIEEMLRVNAVPVTREALCDTTILDAQSRKGHKYSSCPTVRASYRHPSVLMTRSGARPRGQQSLTPHGMRLRTCHSLIPSVGLYERTTARVCWETTWTSMERQGRNYSLPWDRALAGEGDWHMWKSKQ